MFLISLIGSDLNKQSQFGRCLFVQKDKIIIFLDHPISSVVLCCSNLASDLNLFSQEVLLQSLGSDKAYIARGNRDQESVDT